MNQQLVQNSQSFENKPEFLQFAHLSTNAVPNIAPESKKESGELVFGSTLPNNSNEINMEGSFNLGK